MKNKITQQIRTVTDWFGLEFVPARPPAVLVVGAPPTHVAFDLRGFVYKEPALKLEDVGDVLHEAAHAVLGPETLRDELGLMAYEYAAAKHLLQRDAFVAWRRAFADYGLDWTDGDGELHSEVRLGDEVFSSEEWLEHCHDAADCRGWLTAAGGPQQFKGVHPDFTEAHKRKYR